ncbi:rhodanese-like domain-containing protein [Euzebya sp.]|uniref:rhodanese-like domain-containing protein n=1 Tax=Euzebya sp. TaxID=1971409 RepID=UPI003517F726
MEHVDVHTAHAAGEDAVLVDVREQDEWAAGRAPGATHVPLSAFGAATWDPEVRYLFVCRSGARSGQAAMALSRAGYRAANVEGGMLAWAAADLPMEADDGEPHVLSH